MKYVKWNFKLYLHLFYVMLILLMLVGTSRAMVNCTDAGSDGILDNIIIVGNASSCTTDYLDDDVELNYATANATAGMTVLLNDTFYNISNTVWINNSYVTFRGSSLDTILQSTSKEIDMLSTNTDATDITIHTLSANTSFTDGNFSTSRYGISVISHNSTLYNYKSAPNNCYPEEITAGGYNVANGQRSNISVHDVVLNGEMQWMRSNGTFGRNYFYNATWHLREGCESGTKTGTLQIQVVAGNISIYNTTVPEWGTYALRVHGGSTPSWNYYYDNNFSSIGIDSGQNDIYWNNTVRRKLWIIDQGIINNITIKNNIIRNSTYVGGVGSCIYIGHTTTYSSFQVNITNNVLYSCARDGIKLNDADAEINFSNNIIYDYADGYSGINQTVAGNNNATYNMIYKSSGTISNISGISCPTCINQTDPLFNDISIFDFHLKSAYGRWNGSAWVTDAVTSPAIDAGDPTSNYSNEPEPNGNIINMGAYGNTIYASKSTTTDVPPSIPGIPINIASSCGKTYCNTTWQAAEGNVTTDSFNVSFNNGTWNNGSANLFWNNTGMSNGSSINISVWAWNNTGSGNLSTGSITLNTTLTLYSMSGIVTDTHGNVVTSVLVTSSEGSNTTNASGYYIISDLLNGTYTLSISKTGYITGSLDVTILGANAANQNIVLSEVASSEWCEQSISFATTLMAMITFIALSILAISIIGFKNGSFDMNIIIAMAGVGIILGIVGILGLTVLLPLTEMIGC